jgi:hypothetical protein
MVVDRYTKVVLTVIAICMIINLVRGISVVNWAFAQTGGPGADSDDVGHAFQ